MFNDATYINKKYKTQSIILIEYEIILTQLIYFQIKWLNEMEHVQMANRAFKPYRFKIDVAGNKYGCHGNLAELRSV